MVEQGLNEGQEFFPRSCYLVRHLILKSEFPKPQFI